jgi:hypothetical protein
VIAEFYLIKSLSINSPLALHLKVLIVRLNCFLIDFAHYFKKISKKCLENKPNFEISSAVPQIEEHPVSAMLV